MTLTAAGIAELSAQETGTAWLVLLTIDHPDLDEPIRITSDAMATASQGFIFEPFPFEIALPDDVEGRTPQASLQIDNASQEIIALLRGMTTPASLTIQIVRSADPNVVEREWAGIEWRSSQYDVAAITGTLTIDELAAEEFPYITFDGRFKGLWP